jgi:hypothetical protein
LTWAELNSDTWADDSATTWSVVSPPAQLFGGERGDAATAQRFNLVCRESARLAEVLSPTKSAVGMPAIVSVGSAAICSVLMLVIRLISILLGALLSSIQTGAGACRRFPAAPASNWDVLTDWFYLFFTALLLIYWRKHNVTLSTS